jgi:hypothetical protein
LFRDVELAVWDWLTMRVIMWVSKGAGDALFKLFRNDMFQAVGLFMHLVPGIPELFLEEGL